MIRLGEVPAIKRYGLIKWVAVVSCVGMLAACGGTSSSGNTAGRDSQQPPSPDSEPPPAPDPGQTPTPDPEQPPAPDPEQPSAPDPEPPPPDSETPPLPDREESPLPDAEEPPPPDGEEPAPPDSEEPPRPTLSLTASPGSVAPGETTTLTWNSAHASSCEASGGWSGSKSLSGSQVFGPIDEDTRFLLSCSGGGGGVSRQVTVDLDEGHGPVVTLLAEPQQVAVNQSATLTWSSEDASSCTASGAWTGSRETSGSFDTGPLSETGSYSLSCSGPSGNALASVTVEVFDKTLSWRAPTENVDGSPLTDLAGYVVHWGNRSRSYDSSHTIDDPTATNWEVSVGPGKYFFALTAFDADGSESSYSNEVAKTIP